MKETTIITISREFGSGGRRIGELVAERLGIPFYDKALVQMAAKDTGFSEEFINRVERRATSSFLFNLAVTGFYADHSGADAMAPQDSVYFAQSKVIKELAAQGSCVIIGRCADYVLRDNPNCLSVFVYADLESKLRRAVDEYGFEEKKAGRILADRDRSRAVYYNHYTERKWGNRSNYQLMLSTGALGFTDCVDLIVRAAAGQG